MTINPFDIIKLLFLFICINSHSQQNYTSNNIKSVKLLNSKTNSNYPIINFKDQLELSFDDLEADEKDYYYKINHFDYNWKPSGLLKLEFLEGFDDIRIDNFRNSYNTLQKYTHYNLELPNDNFNFKISGNYSVSIHLSNDEKVFEKRFSITENSEGLSLSISKSNKIENIDISQNIDVTINCNNCSKIYNNSSTLRLVILKNNNWSISKTIKKPKYVINNKLIYRDISFNGGNEYLSFDSSNIISTNYRVYKTELKNLYHTYIVTDDERTNKKYEYNPDKNGSFIINGPFSNLDIENDYSIVHFTLKPNTINLKSRVFIIGEFNNFDPNETYELNLKKNKYEGDFKFKQGYYNYIYYHLNELDSENTNYFGGDFWQTENVYSALLYQKKNNDKYFKLIGHSSISSSIIKN